MAHCIPFHDTSILAKTEYISGEAIEIEVHPDKMSREGFSLSR
jgi:hypothetical protein